MIKGGRENRCKSVRWSAVPVPCISRLCLKLKGKQGSGPKGVNDLSFHTRNFVALLLLAIGAKGWILALKVGFRPSRGDTDLEAGIWSSRLRFGPPGRDLGLEAKSKVSRMGFKHQEWDLQGGKAKNVFSSF